MARPGDPWTRAELDALRRLYPSHGCRWEGWGRLLPGRTPDAMVAMAHKLGCPRRRDALRGFSRADAACAARHLRAMAEETGHTTSQCAALVGVALAAANERDGNRAGRGRALAADEGVCLHHARGRLAVARQLAAAWAGEGEPDGDGD